MAAVAASARHDRAASTGTVELPLVAQRSRTWALLWPLLRGLLVASWIVVFVSVWFQPAPNAGVAEPWSSVVLSILYPFALIAAVVTGLNGVWRASLGCSLGAGCMGLVMAYQCAVTLHHAPAWWIYELAAFGYLTALSLGSLLVRVRVQDSLTD